MNQQLRKFWEGRVQKYGHTGWADPAIYAYDQLERLAIFSNVVSSSLPVGATALDFGCGTGDFSRHLVGQGARVWGYDPFVKTTIDNDNFRYLRSLDDVAAVDEKFDLILSVTALDHIMDDDEFVAVLTLLRRKVSATGRMVLMEYAFDGIPTRQAGTYQALRGLDQWRESLAKTGWMEESVSPVPTIPESPSNGYLNFRSSYRVKILRSIALPGKPGSGFATDLLRRHAKRFFSSTGPGTVQSSPLKLMVYAPANR